MAAGDYPTWVYDPTGVNPPMFVLDDPSFVRLLNSPVPSTALVGGSAPITAPTAPIVVAQPAPVLTQIGGTTVVPLGAKFTRMPRVGKR